MSENTYPLNTSDNSQNQDLIRPAKEKARKIITTQQKAVKRKFDQIRDSLSEKEKKVNQELDEILDARLDVLDTCARNLDALTSTLNISQQKLGKSMTTSVTKLWTHTGRLNLSVVQFLLSVSTFQS